MSMKNSFTGEVIISILLVVLLVFFLRPLPTSMPTSMHVVMAPLLIVLFVIFASVMWREIPGDEREQLHKFISARFAYVASVAILVVGVAVQSIQKVVDPWLVSALCIILLAKVAGLVYGYFR